jgi:hypothetical protein
MDPAYCDVIIERWQGLADKLASLEDGTPFKEIAATTSVAAD